MEYVFYDLNIKYPLRHQIYDVCIPVGTFVICIVLVFNYHDVNIQRMFKFIFENSFMKGMLLNKTL